MSSENKPAAPPARATSLLDKRMADLQVWLAEHGPECATEQKHLEEGSAERLYWHYGYMVATRDALSLLASQPAAPDSVHKLIAAIWDACDVTDISDAQLSWKGRAAELVSAFVQQEVAAKDAEIARLTIEVEALRTKLASRYDVLSDSPCGVEGHTMATWTEEYHSERVWGTLCVPEPHMHAYCARCREVRNARIEALESLSNELIGIRRLERIRIAGRYSDKFAASDISEDEVKHANSPITDTISNVLEVIKIKADAERGKP